MTPSSSDTGSESNRRRSRRVLLHIPVILSGECIGGAFREPTQTLVVNAHGALVTLTTKVTHGQKLRVKHGAHAEEERDCQVSYIGPTVEGQTQVGIEFIEPAPDFWHIAFPPDDWVPPAVQKTS